MPRRRAVRFIGASLAALAIPGVSPRLARGARALTCPDGGCGRNRTACPTIVNLGSGPFVCCPPPLNRYYCGGDPSNPPTVKCVDKCPRGDPCPSKELDTQGCPKFNCCPLPNEKCVDGECIPNCARQGKQQCGKQCCERNQECTDWRFSNNPQSKLRRTCLRKCRTIERKCGISLENRCCPKDQVCCGTGGGKFKVCCPLDYVCVTVPSEGGNFKACGPKCKPGQKRCRLRCCEEIAFETLPSGFKRCRCV
jgi:hypothetical protein